MRITLLFLVQSTLWACHAWSHQLAATPMSPTRERAATPAAANEPYATPSGTKTKRDNASEDPNDQSWITSWAAIGDSYSAGIGCGWRFDGDSACARYNFSWPNIINNDERMGNTSRDFQFLACSGATSPEILENQVSQINEGVQVITVTAGGNDAGFADVLKACIFAWNYFTDCQLALGNADDIIASGEFNSSITSLLSAMIPKLGDNGRIYYVGYAPFFDAESTQCNDVSWSFWCTKPTALCSPCYCQ